MDHQYAYITEDAEGSNYSAYVPDLPGCVTTGSTLEEIHSNMREAIRLHVRGLIEDGDPVPPRAHAAEAAQVAQVSCYSSLTARSTCRANSA